MRTRWPDEVTEKMKALLADTPMAYRKYIEGQIEPEALRQAEKLGRSEIDEDAMIRAFIVCVPRHLRDGIHEVLGEHDIDLQYYGPVFDEAVSMKYRRPANEAPKPSA
ncbi:MAG: hypothetical protein HY975_03170 [Candidatus Kerfeldbacteria bacterium]|nr:hypothetical protein [Candidatus Kerfeldbacteria bacterium]